MLLLTGIIGYLGTLMVVCVYFIVLLTFLITVCWILQLVELLFLVLGVPFFFGPFRVCYFLTWWGLSVVSIARLVTWFVCGIPVRVSSDVFFWRWISLLFSLVFCQYCMALVMVSSIMWPMLSVRQAKNGLFVMLRYVSLMSCMLVWCFSLSRTK